MSEVYYWLIWIAAVEGVRVGKAVSFADLDPSPASPTSPTETTADTENGGKSCVHAPFVYSTSIALNSLNQYLYI